MAADDPAAAEILARREESDATEPLPGTESYLEAFRELSFERPRGALGGEGPIPWSAIDEWCAREGIDDPDEREQFVMMIRALDREYLTIAGERARERAARERTRQTRR